MTTSETLEAAQVPETATPIPETTAATTPVAAPEATAPAPSTDTPAEPTSLLDVALKALGQERESATTTAAQPAGDDKLETATTPTAAQAETQGEAPDDVPMLPAEVFKALPQEARSAFAKLRSTVGKLKPDADRGAAVAEFIRASGVTPEEYVQLQDVGALIKRDPAAARKILADKLAEIDRALGITLPEDIARDVDGGFITEERAAELSRARADADRATAALRATTEQRNTDAMLTEVTAWEAEVRRADPDFGRKLPNIQALTRAAAIEARNTGKPVASGADAVRLAQRAYAQVNDMLASFRPAPVATRPGPSSAASAPAAPLAPKSLLEAAAAGLRRAG